MIERRQTTRYDLGAIAEVIDLDSREEMVAVTRDLSSCGCFIRTKTPLEKGTAVIVRIRWSGTDFAARGKVTGNITREGMGIEFVEMRPKDQAILEEWLDPRPRSQSSIAGIPVTVFGRIPTGEFSEETETQITNYDRASLRLAAGVAPGQVVRLRNRLTRQEQDCRVLSVAAEPKTSTVKLLTIEFLESARNFWKHHDETRH